MIKCALQYGDTLQIELEFRKISILGQEKNGVPCEKLPRARTRTKNNPNPHVTPSQGIETRLH